jgi:hypothetical protein
MAKKRKRAPRESVPGGPRWQAELLRFLLTILAGLLVAILTRILM